MIYQTSWALTKASYCCYSTDLLSHKVLNQPLINWIPFTKMRLHFENVLTFIDFNQPAFGKKSGGCNDKSNDDKNSNKDERKDPLRAVLVRAGVVDEEGEKSVVRDRSQEGRVEQRVDVRGELPQATSPVVHGPGRVRIVPVHLKCIPKLKTCSWSTHMEELTSEFFPVSNLKNNLRS